MIVDLHCHSHFSDGVFTPEMLCLQAIAHGVKVLSLTDHDTVAGVMALHAAAKPSSLHIVNGIEFSALWEKQVIHIIGLNFDIDDRGLVDLITEQNDNRIARAIAIADRLQSCGMSNGYQKACEIAGHDRVGRPHFARALVKEGLVTDIRTAFKRFLTRGRTAYVEVQWASLERIVRTIHAAKGQAVIAHPLKYGLSTKQLRLLFKNFKEAGGVAAEVVSGSMQPTQIDSMARLCRQFNLLASSGSDFHAQGFSAVGIGQQAELPACCKPIWSTWDFINAC